MPTQVITADLDDEMAARLTKMAATADQTPAQIIRAALRLYAGLPLEAQAAVRATDTLSIDQTAEVVVRMLERQALDRRWHNLHGRLMAAMPAGPAGDEDALLDHAVHLTR